MRNRNLSGKMQLFDFRFLPNSSGPPYCKMAVYKNIETSWKQCTNNRPFLGTFQMENCILAQLTKYLSLTSFLKVFLQF